MVEVHRESFVREKLSSMDGGGDTGVSKKPVHYYPQSKVDAMVRVCLAYQDKPVIPFNSLDDETELEAHIRYSFFKRETLQVSGPLIKCESVECNGESMYHVFRLQPKKNCWERIVPEEKIFDEIRECHAEVGHQKSKTTQNQVKSKKHFQHHAERLPNIH